VKAIATIGAVVLYLAGGPGCGQESADSKPHVAPPEITILKHAFGGERRFVTEATPQSGRGGEPATRVVSQLVMTVSVKAKSNATKTIVGVSWYFVLEQDANAEYLSIPFITPVDIAARQTKTFKGEIDRLPQHRRAVTVDELKNPIKTPHERIVITCLIFSDGTFSPLNEAAKRDCRRLQVAPEIRKKIQKP
jgi:hypothetical protein